MSVKMKFFITTSLLLVAATCIEASQNETEQNETEPVCRNTTINGDFTNQTVQVEALRKYVNDFWASEDAGAKAYHELSPDALNFIEKVISGNDTDSPSKVRSLAYFTLSFSLQTILSEHDRGFCFLAQSINASAIWAESKDGRYALKTIGSAVRQRSGWCLAIVAESLELNDCKKLPPVHIGGLGKCFKRGRVYDIENALKYFGKDVPCSILDSLYRLYYSDDYNDNLVAVVYVSALTELTDDALSAYQLDQLLEVLYSVVDPKDKACCCKTRRERFTEVCDNISETDLSEVIEKYANTECPPEAAYLR